MIAPHAACIDANTATTYINCQLCNTEHVFLIPTKDYFEWNSGKQAQDVLHYIDPDSREILISGICSDCFDSLFHGE